jgi:hypothetical protein
LAAWPLGRLAALLLPFASASVGAPATSQSPTRPHLSVANVLKRIPISTWVTSLLGLVLLVAAVLKCHQLITGYVPGRTFLLSRWFQTLTVEIELALGLWLISGFYRNLAARVGLGFFALLAAASAYLILAGEECCGCLGRLAVNPWFSFVFDLIAVCSLWLLPASLSGGVGFHTRPNWATGVVACFCFLAPFLLVASPEYRTASTAAGDFGGNGELVVLDVENWVGKRLPILEQIDIGKRLGQGDRTILLYHWDCPKCEESIRLLRSTDATTQVALIHVPSLSGLSIRPLFHISESFTRGSLVGSHRWLVRTPLIVRLVDGKVMHVQLES